MIKETFPNPDQLKNQVRLRLKQLTFNHQNQVFQQIFGLLLADRCIEALTKLVMAVPTLPMTDEVFTDVTLALMAVGQPTMNLSDRALLFSPVVLDSVRIVGRWLTKYRLGVELGPAVELWPNLNFAQALESEIANVSGDLPPPNISEQYVTNFLKLIYAPQTDGESTVGACYAMSLALLNAKKFSVATAVMLEGYQAAFDQPVAWEACQYFFELLHKASADGLITNDVPGWVSVVALAEGANLMLVPAESVEGVSQMLRVTEAEAQMMVAQGA